MKILASRPIAILLLVAASSRAAITPSYDSTIGSAVVPGLRDPRGVATDGSGNVYVADTGNHRMVKFSRTGDFLLQWGVEGTARGQFVYPGSIAIDSADNVYVADWGNEWIQKFASNGAYLTGWYCPHPTALAVDRNRHVYVADRGVQSLVFDHWGGGYTYVQVPGVRKFSGDGVVLGQWPINTAPFSQYDGYPGTYYTGGLAVSQNGDIWVAYAYRFTSPFEGSAANWSGAGLELFVGDRVYAGNLGTRPAPEALAIDNANNLYWPDHLNNRLDILHADGLWVEWQFTVDGVNFLSRPRGIAVDPGGNFLYLADSGNNRIVVFALRRPEIVCPTNVLVAADPGQCSALVAFNVSATGDPVPVVTCTLGEVVITSPFAFPVGTNFVTCTASNSGGVVNCDFTVTVVDTEPPRITCPANLTVDFVNANGAPVSFTATATDNCGGMVGFSCAPASGSILPIGRNTIECIAIDAAGNSAVCHFAVTVLGARGVIQSVLSDLLAVRAGVSRRADSEQLDVAIALLTDALDPALWQDETHLGLKPDGQVFQKEKVAVLILGKLMNDSRSSVSATMFEGPVARLANAAWLLAVIQVQEATAAGVNPQKLAEALDQIAAGEADAAAGRMGSALQHFRNAWARVRSQG